MQGDVTSRIDSIMQSNQECIRQLTEINRYKSNKQAEANAAVHEYNLIMDVLRSIANETYLMDKETLNIENSKIFIMKLRDIENKNDLLSKIASRYGISDEVYIREEIQRIDDIVSNHFGKKRNLR